MPGREFRAPARDIISKWANGNHEVIRAVEDLFDRVGEMSAQVSQQVPTAPAPTEPAPTQPAPTLTVTQSAAVASIAGTDNTEETLISTIGQAVKANIETQAVNSAGALTELDNRIEVQEGGAYFVKASVTVATATTETVALYLAVNGVAVQSSVISTDTGAFFQEESITTFEIVELSASDYVEVWIANEKSTSSITVKRLKLAMVTLA